MRRVLWMSVVVLVVIGLVAVRMARVREKEAAPTAPAVTLSVRVAAVREGRVARVRHVLGTVVGAEEADVAPRVMAQVLDVRVREGDTVRRGQLLVKLDARELEDAVAQAEAALQTAREGLAAAETALAVQRATTARDRTLVEARAIAQEQWDRSRAAEAAAQAQREAARGQVAIAERRLNQARTQLDYARLTAPFDGVVAARLADPGALAVPGRAIVRLVRNRGVRVRAALPAEEFGALKIGQPLTLAAGDIAVSARLSRVVPAMGEAHLATFEADLTDPPPGLVSGATVGVDLALADATGLVVPSGALLDTGVAAFVYRVDGGLVHPVKVEVLSQSADEVAIRGPIASGDRVVVAQPSRLMRLTDGAKVQVAER